MEEEQAHELMMEDTTAADLDSQPLNDLGVSFMDQDELERNVAAQVCTFSFLNSTDGRRMRLYRNETMSSIGGVWRKLRRRECIKIVEANLISEPWKGRSDSKGIGSSRQRLFFLLDIPNTQK